MSYTTVNAQEALSCIKFSEESTGISSARSIIFCIAPAIKWSFPRDKKGSSVYIIISFFKGLAISFFKGLAVGLTPGKAFVNSDNFQL